jgi:hypothetical protein
MSDNFTGFELRRGRTILAIRPNNHLNGWTGLIDGVPVARGRDPGEALQGIPSVIHRSLRHGLLVTW